MIKPLRINTAILLVLCLIGFKPQAVSASSDTTGNQKGGGIQSSASVTKESWYTSRNKNHEPPGVPVSIDLSAYNAHFMGDRNNKTIYMTFNLGYENGYTEVFLDVLKKYDIPAAFFVVGTYFRDNQSLIKRIIDDGHIVASHSASHHDMSTLSVEDIVSELNKFSDYFKETLGYEMPRFFRPPSGYYNERVLDVAYQLGYTTFFWSLAYFDWDVNDQPGKDAAYKIVMDNIHNGCIISLHTVSKSNAEAFESVIKSLMEQGYEFDSIANLSENDTNPGSGANNVSVVYNAKKIDLDPPALTKNGFVFLPLEDILPVIGADFIWNSDISTAMAILNDNKVEFGINHQFYRVNGDMKEMPDGLAPFVKHDRLYVIADYIVEGLGLAAERDDAANSIIIK